MTAERSAAQDLVEHGVCWVPDVINAAGVDRARVMEEWLAFLRRPKSDRERWTMGNPEDPDDGYIYRDGSHGHDLKKHFFHFNPGVLADLMGVSNFQESEMSHWLIRCHAIFDACVHQLDRLAHELDAVMPGYNFGEHVRSPISSGLGKLRFLYYGACENAKDGDIVAKVHGDHSFITLHLTDSHTGMVWYDHDGQEHVYQEKPGYTLAFAGKKMERLTEGQIPAIRHGVRHFDAAADDRNRSSLVFFGHIGIPSE